MICKDIFKVSYLNFDLSQLIDYLLSFHTGQTSEGHICDMVSLNICQTKTLIKSLLSLWDILRSFHYLDNFVDIVKCDNKTL